MKMLVYLHGFMGSSQSFKAQLSQQWFASHLPEQRLWVPDLPYSPREAMALVLDGIGDVEASFIGSSLGGYYANYLAEKLATRAVMINPAVYPFELLQAFLGPQQSPYTGEQFELTSEHIKELRALFVERMQNPRLRKVMLQTGDETLDYREAEQYYRLSRLLIEEGGDHSFVDFQQHLPAIARFLLE